MWKFLMCLSWNKIRFITADNIDNENNINVVSEAECILSIFMFHCMKIPWRFIVS